MSGHGRDWASVGALCDKAVSVMDPWVWAIRANPLDAGADLLHRGNIRRLK